MTSRNTIVEYFGDQSGYRCGYCKSSTSNYSHGMWGHTLTPQDYLNLINRGWRRSGKYLYKPTNNLACCPAYTISCHALEFQLSKSQKKVLKRFNKFLLSEDDAKSTAGRSNCHKSQDSKRTDMDELVGGENITSFAPKEGKAHSNINLEEMDVGAVSDSSKAGRSAKEKLTTLIRPKGSGAVPLKSTPASDSVTNVSKGDNVVIRSNFRKSKEFRAERKRQKLLQKGIDPSKLENASKKPESKALEDFIALPSDAKKKFCVKTVRVGTTEFEETFNTEVGLYRIYQMTIHQDKEEDCTAKQFRRFLCDSPLIKTGCRDDEKYGTFHQQYYIDDQMIAVGVIDLLPDCVSSVYFFYSPDFMFLSLGTFGALREIAYVRELQSRYPSIRHYYMGFYIHSCVKMRYKGSFFPSYLLCPEEYTWHLLDDNARNKLSASKYSRLNESTEKVFATVNVNEVRVLFRGHRMLYEQYKAITDLSSDEEDVQEYANLVGDICSKSIMLYRHLDED